MESNSLLADGFHPERSETPARESAQPVGKSGPSVCVYSGFWANGVFFKSSGGAQGKSQRSTICTYIYVYSVISDPEPIGFRNRGHLLSWCHFQNGIIGLRYGRQVGRPAGCRRPASFSRRITVLLYQCMLQAVRQ